MNAPTREQVALEAARYATNEFRGEPWESWRYHSEEFAQQLLLKDPTFLCTVDYATAKVMERMRYGGQIAAMAAQRGGGAKGIAYVVGHIVGEWLSGRTTIDRELGTWG